MIINEVLVLNLKRREDRKYAMIGHLCTHGIDVPTDRLHFFPANDGQVYETVDEVIEAAAADGFPHYKQIVREKPHIGAKSRIATDWSWCQVMRYIAQSHDSSRLVLFLYDDMRLKYDFYNLELVMQMLMERPVPFYALQLYCYSWPWDPEPENYWLDGFIQEGFGGRGDYGLVLSPDGAQRLLNFHFEDPFDTVNNDLAILSRFSERKIGFYSVRQNIVEVSPWYFENDREPAAEKIVYNH